MREHTMGTREEWLAARIALLPEEKELTRRSDEPAATPRVGRADTTNTND
jgi:predicted dithiol-disulfide oxidoreductase (DUF899 family)